MSDVPFDRRECCTRTTPSSRSNDSTTVVIGLVFLFFRYRYTLQTDGFHAREFVLILFSTSAVQHNIQVHNIYRARRICNASPVSTMHNNIDFVPIITSTIPFPISRLNNIAISPPSIVAKIGTRWKICLEHSNTNYVFIIIRLHFVVGEGGRVAR